MIGVSGRDACSFLIYGPFICLILIEETTTVPLLGLLHKLHQLSLVQMPILTSAAG